MLSLLELLSVVLLTTLVKNIFDYLKNGELSDFNIDFIFYLRDLPTKSIFFFILIFVIFFLIIKNLSGIILSKKLLNFLTNSYKLKSQDIFMKYNSIDYEEAVSIDVHEIEYIFSKGIQNIVIGNVYYLLQFLSEISILMVIAGFILYSNFNLAVFSVLYFSLAFVLINKLLSARIIKSSRAIIAGELSERSDIKDTIAAYREHVLYNTRKIRDIKYINFKQNFSSVLAKSLWYQQISKYVYEILGIFGIFLISLLTLIDDGFENVLTQITIFFIAFSRLAPSFLRLQQASGAIKSNIGSTDLVLSNLRKLESSPKLEFRVGLSKNVFKIPLGVVIKDMDFYYKSSTEKVLNGINLDILPNSVTAIVGPSGSGKTTLVDLILGLLKPSSGLIQYKIGSSLENVYGHAGYIPQQVKLITGTLKENILFYREPKSNTDTQILDVIEITGLSTLLSSLENGLETLINPANPKLSLGQIQKIGIARALLYEPSLLVMDEATSSLDADSENDINVCVNNLKRFTTVIIVAHRLSTVSSADKIVYLEHGKIIATGKFQELRTKVEDFNRHAKLMGF